MNRPGRIALGIGLACLAPSLAAAQEVQVPLDEAGRIEELDGRLARQLGLFVDRYEGVQEVRLYQLSDTEFSLEIIHLVDGGTTRVREAMSAAEVAALRQRVSERIAQNAPAMAVDQDGRASLLRTMTGLGVAFYGWAVPVALGIDDEQAAVGLYMLTAGASFFLPWQATRYGQVTEGQAQLGRYGATRGGLHGLALYGLAAGEGGDAEGRSAVTMALLGSILEGAVGFALAGHEGLTAGEAAAVGAVGDLGILQGIALPVLLGVDDTRAISAVGLAGSAAGLVGGRALAGRRDYSWGDVHVMYTAGALGAFGAAALADWSEDAEPVAAGVMLGSIGGALLGDRLVADRDFTWGQSVLVSLGTIAGGLVGLGAANLADEDGSSAFYLTLSGLGAGIGFAGMYASLAADAIGGGARGGMRGPRSGLRIEVSPGVLRVPQRAAPNTRTPAPMLNVRVRF